jgi:hypothetical protein
MTTQIYDAYINLSISLYTSPYHHCSPMWDVNDGETQDEVDNDPTIPWKKDSPQGFFWMPFDKFKTYFNNTYLCKLFPNEKFQFYCMNGDWHYVEAGGPPNTGTPPSPPPSLLLFLFPPSLPSALCVLSLPSCILTLFLTYHPCSNH